MVEVFVGEQGGDTDAVEETRDDHQKQHTGDDPTPVGAGLEKGGALAAMDCVMPVPPKAGCGEKSTYV